MLFEEEIIELILLYVLLFTSVIILSNRTSAAELLTEFAFQYKTGSGFLNNAWYAFSVQYFNAVGTPEVVQPN